MSRPSALSHRPYRVLCQVAQVVALLVASGLAVPNARAGSLLVSDGGDVRRYNATTGAYVGLFFPHGSGGIGSATAMAYGPDGTLYVCDGANQSVVRYHGQTGVFLNLTSANRLIADLAARTAS